MPMVTTGKGGDTTDLEGCLVFLAEPSEAFAGAPIPELSYLVCVSCETRVLCESRLIMVTEHPYSWENVCNCSLQMKLWP